MLRPRSDGLPHLSRFHPPQKDRPLLCWADAVSRVGWEGAAERPRYSQRPTVAWVVGSAEVGLGQRSHRGSDSLQRGRWKETLNSYCKRYLYGIFTYYAYLPLSLSLKFFFFCINATTARKFPILSFFALLPSQHSLRPWLTRLLPVAGLPLASAGRGQSGVPWPCLPPRRSFPCHRPVSALLS